jgi:hypothetical protein
MACGVADWHIPSMPVSWTVDSKKKLMRILGTGNISHAELVPLIDAVVREGALGYRKLVDVSQANTTMTSEEMLDIGVRTRSMQDPINSGPVALVLPVDGVTHAEAQIGMIAAGERSMRIFRDLAPAERWIETQRARRRRPTAVVRT